MKAKADVVLDRTAFEKLKRIMPGYLTAGRQTPESNRPQALPQEVAFKLTNQCNLRCAHCYQWNSDGHHHDLERREQLEHLSFQVISDVFEATRSLKSNVYLWGGEPLMYRHWHDLTDLLERDRRWTSICTNGFFIENRVDSLLKISSRLEIDIAVDGLETQHDEIRGHGAFNRTLKGIELLLERKRHGEYVGEISINCVITNDLVPRLMDVVRFWEEVGVDTVYLSLLWYLSEPASAAMDRYAAECLPWIRREQATSTTRPSWHAYKYGMASELVEPLLAQLDRINEKTWKIKVRYNPALNPKDFKEFLAGSERPAAGKTRCLAVLSRMDVLPNGDVVSCKFFPESYVGNLHAAPTSAIWLGTRFERVRKTLELHGLMPVCSKCSLLYSRGV